MKNGGKKVSLAMKNPLQAKKLRSKMTKINTPALEPIDETVEWRKNKRKQREN